MEGFYEVASCKEVFSCWIWCVVGWIFPCHCCVIFGFFWIAVRLIWRVGGDLGISVAMVELSGELWQRVSRRGF